jgi:predicted dehydrogenase
MKQTPAQKITRRTFLRTAALVAGATSLPARSWAKVPGANDDVRMAVIGFHGRGKDHIREWSSMAGVRLTALCDVDHAVLDAGVEDCRKKGISVEAFTDVRKLLASDNIDAVSIATPNHWHALAAVWAIQNGKDVYVEKPVSFDIWEGQQLVAAAHKYKKMVQAGTQSRSSTGIHEAVEWVRQGQLGRIRFAHALCYKRRGSIGKTNGPQPVPPTVDYDLWTGPAPLHPPRRQRFHYDWHWFWDYGAGDLGNQGVHEMDVARWFLGESYGAPKAVTVGGRFGYSDDAETPNTVVAFHDYYAAPLIMEVRGLPAKTDAKEMDKYHDVSIGVVVECEGGRILVKDYNSAIAVQKDGKEIKRFEGSTNHFANFIQAVRSRQETDLHAPILEGHRSTALCHVSNISYRLGHSQPPQAIREKIKGDPGAEETFDRMSQHLAANGINLEQTQAVIGPVLTMNPMTEEFVKNKAANQMLRRAPRTGFAIKLA